jgi:hypothetical protein
MGTSSLAALAGMGLFAMLVMIVVGILVAALVLSWIAGAVAMVIIGMVSSGGGGGLLSLIVQFLGGAFVVNYLLLSQNGSQIGFGKACLVQVIYLVIFLVLAMIFAALMAVFFGSMLAHG